MKALALSLLALVACPPMPPSPPPGPDADAAPSPLPPAPPPASDAAPATCSDACSRMATLGCPGVNAQCPATVAKVERDRLIRASSGAPVTCKCLADAVDRAAVEACGIGCR